ncbi:CLIP domain-containing serine protease B10-like isoform X2 [Cylas formicarius]|uniref:CLIP domain-containing serine protease B10-like isoform X2 n=1 Tax=Cylas formicarius TaxID=197179 RepID=UPI0029589755|nr:CLIP domain-containing serine protease B10-like isoform X2 [Cylas formicarius]
MNNGAFRLAVVCVLLTAGLKKDASCLKTECVPTDRCPFADKFLKQGLTRETIEFIDRARCGYDDQNRLKIWCIQSTHCRTPDNEVGSCMYYKKCPKYVDLLKTQHLNNRSVSNYLKKFGCESSKEKEIQVCCPLPETVMRTRFDDSSEEDFKLSRHNEESDQNRRHASEWHRRHHAEYPHAHSYERHGWFDWDNSGSNSWEDEFHHDTIRATSTGSPDITDDTSGEVIQEELVCKTPDDEPGVCKNIRDCSPMVNLLKTMDKDDDSQKKYIRNFKCVKGRRRTAEIRVCCPKGNLSFPVEPELRLYADSLKPFSKICGKQGAADNRIYGGTATDLAEFPWMALFQYQSRHGLVYGCAGNLITNRIVVTAAHCVEDAILKSRGLNKIHRVVLGEYDIRNETDCFHFKYGTDCADKPQYFAPSKVVKHDSYHGTDNDIALVKLDRNVTFTDYISPICLPEGNVSAYLKGNEPMIIAGWGRTDPAGELSPVKKKATLPYVAREVCNEFNPQPLTEGQMCLGSGNGIDSCNGDSGGPVMMDVVSQFGDRITNLFGIISYGFGSCGVAPSVATFVPEYVDWIKRTVSVLESDD